MVAVAVDVSPVGDCAAVHVYVVRGDTVVDLVRDTVRVADDIRDEVSEGLRVVLEVSRDGLTVVVLCSTDQVRDHVVLLEFVVLRELVLLSDRLQVGIAERDMLPCNDVLSDLDAVVVSPGIERDRDGVISLKLVEVSTDVLLESLALLDGVRGIVMV